AEAVRKLRALGHHDLADHELASGRARWNEEDRAALPGEKIQIARRPSNLTRLGRWALPRWDVTALPRERVFVRRIVTVKAQHERLEQRPPSRDQDGALDERSRVGVSVSVGSWRDRSPKREGLSGDEIGGGHHGRQGR